jgi:hypothetical protein
LCAYTKVSGVDVGYHFTDMRGLDQIRTDGLLTQFERESNNIASRQFHGASFGDGVYTGNNPFAFCGYEDTGLLVVRLKGNMYCKKSNASSQRKESGAFSSFSFPLFLPFSL